MMTGSVALGVAGGFGLDRFFHTRPWFLLGGGVLGVVVGFVSLMFAMQRLGK